MSSYSDNPQNFQQMIGKVHSQRRLLGLMRYDDPLRPAVLAELTLLSGRLRLMMDEIRTIGSGLRPLGPTF